MNPHRGTLVLVFGVLGFLGCVPLAPIAWWMGTHDSMKMAEGTMDRSGKTATEIGRVLGMITTIILFIAFIGGLVFRMLLST